MRAYRVGSTRGPSGIVNPRWHTYPSSRIACASARSYETRSASRCGVVRVVTGYTAAPLYWYNLETVPVRYQISGGTAAEISATVEDGVRRGALASGQSLPPVRELAGTLGVSP